MEYNKRQHIGLRIKHRKKGQEDYLVKAIIIVISFIILLFVVAKIGGMFQGSITKETCHASVLTRGYEIEGLSAGKLLSNLKCKTQEKCLSMGGECPKGYEKISVSNEDDIKKEIANSMYDCWWMLGEGEINFFEDRALAKNNCVFCSIIHFDSKIQSTYPKISGMMEYLSENKIPGKEFSYFDYLFSSSKINELKPIDIQTNSDYLVDFMMKNKGWVSSNWKKITVGGLATVGGIAIGGLAIYAALPTGGMSLEAIPILMASIPVIINKVELGGAIAAGGMGMIGFGALKQGPVGDILFTLTSYDSESIKSLGCQNIESIP